MRETSLFGKVIALFVAVVPFVVSNQLFSGSINAKYFLTVGVVTAALLYVVYLTVQEKHTLSFRGRWLLGALGLVVVVHSISAFTGVFTGASLMSDILRSTGVIFLTYIALFAWLLSELFTHHEWRLVRRAVVWSASVYAVLTFFVAQGLDLSGRFLTIDFETAGLTIGNTTFAGAFLVLGLIFTLLELTRSAHRRWRRTVIVLLLLQLISPLLLSAGVWTGDVSFASPLSLLGEARASSAAAWGLTVFLGGLYVLRRFTHNMLRARLSYAYAGAWFLGVCVLVGLLFTPGSVVQEKYIEQSTAARILVWEGSGGAIQERPLLGWGPENFRLAHDGYIDSRLYLNENIGEVWFDRAHNIIIDTLVSVGVVGAVVMLVFVIYFIVVVRRAYKQGIIGYWEAVVVSAFPFVHVLQLQTSFDTTLSYVLGALFVGYVLWLERTTVSESVLTPLWHKVTAVLLLVFTLGAGWFVLVEEYSRQRALFSLFVSQQQTVDEQVERIHRALDGTTSFEALRLSSSSFIKGLLASVQQENITNEERGLIVQSGLRQIEVYEEHYRGWLARVPSDYRARMNYAYLLLIGTALGDDGIEEARSLVDGSYELSPGNPLTLVMDSMVLLFSGDLDTAQERLDTAVAQNRDTPFVQGVVEYFERQREQYPRITVLNLENL